MNITSKIHCGDFVSLCKARNIPPNAAVMYACAEASLAVENFRWRLVDGEPMEVRSLIVGHTVLDSNRNLNFSMIDHTSDFGVFVERYVADRDIAHSARSIRGEAGGGRNCLFTTCVPWLDFSAFEHPVARFGDATIPNIAIGKFIERDNGVGFSLAVQAHHGFVDGLHIYEFMENVRDQLSSCAFLDHLAPD